ncbi:hypothetical protein HN873_032326 [Arachis hypogaea]
MTLMHYLCKVLADRSPGLLDFHLDLVSLEATTKVMIYAWLKKKIIQLLIASLVGLLVLFHFVPL